MDAVKLNASLVPQGYVAVLTRLVPANVPSAKAEGSDCLSIIPISAAPASEELRNAVLEACLAVGARHNAVIGSAYEAGTGVE